jgi:hypothetical protein
MEDISSQEKKFMVQQSKADSSKAEYEKALSKLNSTIDNFDI